MPTLRLTESEIAALVAHHPGWQRDGAELTRTFHFLDFPAAIAFVVRVAPLAEALGHHPDIDIRYNRVRLALTTHDAGGLSTRDAEFLTDFDRLQLFGEKK